MPKHLAQNVFLLQNCDKFFINIGFCWVLCIYAHSREVKYQTTTPMKFKNRKLFFRRKQNHFSKKTFNIFSISRSFARVSKCNMSLDVSNPNFQVNLGYVQLLKVEIKLETTQRHSVNEGSILPFDRKIQDPTHSFFIENSTFIAPWKGNYTFTKFR